jgi:hypothetical protein
MNTLRACFTAAMLVGIGNACAAPNLLVNEGFESPSIGASSESDTNPADWTVFSSITSGEKVGLSAAVNRSGSQSARITSQGAIESYQGLYQSISASVGTSYTFSVYVRNGKTNPLKGPARGQITIEWRDAHDTEIARTWGPDWGVSLFSAHWVKFDMTAKAPPNTARARFVIVQFDGKTGGGGGSFLLDDAMATEQP